MKKGDIYKRRKDNYEIVKIHAADNEFMWVYVVPLGKPDELVNRTCFGRKVFKEQFKFVKHKEKEDG